MNRKIRRSLLFAAMAMITSLLTGCSPSKDNSALSDVYDDMSGQKLSELKYPCDYKQKELRCKYEDKDILGTLYTPDNGRKKHPVVILSHGYNSIGSDMRDVAVSFAQNGVIAYTFDFCGGSTRALSSGKSTDMSIESEQSDLRSVIDMISSLDEVDASKLYLYGESQGGFVSALTASEMPERISGMFLIFPAFCIPDQWLAMNPDDMKKPFSFMGLMISRAYYDGVPRYDIYEHIKAFKNPVLIYHGDKDTVVDISYAEKADKAFPDSSLTILKGAGHGFFGADRKLVIDGICKFFAERKINA